MGCLKLIYRSQAKIPISRGREHKSPLRVVYQKPNFKAKTVRGFISVDPLVDKYADLNPYNYAGNKPINKIDIDGLQEENKTETKTNETSGSISNESNENEVFTTVDLKEAKIIGVRQSTNKEKIFGFLKGLAVGVLIAAAAVAVVLTVGAALAVIGTGLTYVGGAF